MFNAYPQMLCVVCDIDDYIITHNVLNSHLNISIQLPESPFRDSATGCPA